MPNLQTYLPPAGKPIREWSDSELLAKAADCFDWINRHDDCGHWVVVDLQDGDEHYSLLGDHTESEDVMVAAFAAVDKARKMNYMFGLHANRWHTWNPLSGKHTQMHHIGTSGHTHARAMLMAAVEAAMLESEQSDVAATDN